jgi:hypothetical protein
LLVDAMPREQAKFVLTGYILVQVTVMYRKGKATNYNWKPGDFDGSYTEETNCMKVVSCNKFHPNNFFLINTKEKFEVLAVVKMTMLLFWVVTQCRLGETRCLHLRGLK